MVENAAAVAAGAHWSAMAHCVTLIVIHVQSGSAATAV